MLQRYLHNNEEYELVNGKCSVIDVNAINPVVLMGCLKEVDGKCGNCANGFIRKNGKCEKGVKECLEYDKNGKCMFCNEEYSLMFG